MLRSDPAPAELVSGTVDAVELTFLDPVRPDVEIVVLDEVGRPVDGLRGTELSDDGITARAGFAPLESAGGYVVDFAFTAQDGDRQRQSYRFTYRPPARPAGPPAAGGADRLDPARVAAAGLAGAVLVLACAVAVRRRRN